MTNTEAKKFLEAVNKDIWSGNNLTKFDKYYHKDFKAVAYLPNEEIELDYDSCKRFLHDTAKTRYKVDTDFEEIVAQGNKSLCKFKQRSVNRNTNQVMNTRVAFQYELDNGKIKRAWVISNRSWSW